MLTIRVKDELYAFKEDKLVSWTCFQNLLSGEIQRMNIINPPTARLWPSLINYKDHFIFVCGGANPKN